MRQRLGRMHSSGRENCAEAAPWRGKTLDEFLGLSEELEAGLLIAGSRGLGGTKRK